MTVRGMSVQALAGEVVASVVADEAGEGCDISAGMFGPQFSALIRRIVDEYLKPIDASGCPCDPSGSAGLRCPDGAGKLLCDPGKPAKYDDTLVPFVALMRAELHANSEKGDRPGWLAMDTNTALFEIYYHMAKLTYAIRKEDGAGAREFAADVANMCMMLLDTTGLLGVPK